MTMLNRFNLFRAATLVLFAFLLLPSHGQTVNASLGGIVSDPSGGRIPGASVTLVNNASHDTRKSTTNNGGDFQFSAVPSGTYTLRVSSPGFSTLIERGIELNPNDVRNLSEIHLRVGEVSADVTVEATADVPDSGERSTLITASDIKKLSTVGRDVGELLKTQSGFSLLQSGLGNAGATDPEVVSTSGAGLGNYVGSGAPGNGASMISDGANVTDPGNGSGQTQTVNMDMVAEVKIETSNFGADTAHGPTVITAVGKSGGSSYHGTVYTFGRTAKANAEDWYQKFIGLPPIQDHYVYPGFNVGGPIVFPKSNFNRNKRLTFDAGGEDYIQRNVYAYGSALESFIQALVPTDQSTNPGGEAGMRQGNFSQSELANYIGQSVSAITSGCTASGALSAYYNVCAQPNNNPGPGAGTAITSGQFAGGAAGFDPGARALLSEFPLPTGPTVNGYNWGAQNLTNQDLYQVRGRVDFAKSDNDKIYGVYNAEYGRNTGIPEQVYYSPSFGGTAQGGLDTPGKIINPVTSNTSSLNYTHVFSTNATNEAFAALAYVADYFYSGDEHALLKSTIGYPYNGIYSRTASCPTCGSDQFPQLGTYSDTNHYGLPLAITPDFSNGEYISKKFLPSGGDNFTYQYKSHTLKVGVYLERDSANQTDLSPITNGQIGQYYVSPNAFTDAACPSSTPCHTPDAGGAFAGAGPNYLADFLLGDIDSFQQQNFNPRTNLYYWTISEFVNDSWKATKQLTVDYGVRFDHLGAWTDAHGLGIATFNPSLYSSDLSSNTNLPGVRWHGGSSPNSDPSLPLSGDKTRFVFFSPRFGLAYDLYGNGKTIMRGGWGMYRAHDSWNDFSPSAATAQGLLIQNVGGNGQTSLAGVDAAAAATVSSNAGLICDSSGTSGCPSISALDPSDNEQPLTETYSFTVTQQMSKSMVFDIAYVGNQSHDLLTDSISTTTQGDIQNINAIPLPNEACKSTFCGTNMFQPDPNPSDPTYYDTFVNPEDATVAEENDFRPYKHYTDLLVPRHILYANYNSLQVGLNKQKGALNFNLNYTFSKAQGVRGGYNNGYTEDPTNLRADYGPLAFDRTNIVNLSYSYDEGQHFHKSRLVDGFVNNWFVSGITNLSSGPNLQAVYSPDLALGGLTTTSANGAQCFGGVCNLNNLTLLGTPDVYLQPSLVASAGCPSANPTSGLKAHQYINAACFGIAPQGTNGPTNLGYIRGPGFFNSDLTVQRSFPLANARSIQARVSAFNFLNHPITSFNSRATDEASLEMSGSSFATAAASNTTNTNPNSNGNCEAAGSTCFGYAGYKTGRRVMEFSIRYTF